MIETIKILDDNYDINTISNSVKIFDFYVKHTKAELIDLSSEIEKLNNDDVFYIVLYVLDLYPIIYDEIKCRNFLYNTKIILKNSKKFKIECKKMNEYYENI